MEKHHLGLSERPFEGVSFMVVDDSIDMIVMLDRMLRRRGARQVWREQAVKSALASVVNQQTCPDMIISDCNMRPLSGLHLLQAVRCGLNQHIPRQTPFVLVTGHGDAEIVRCAQLLDVNGYILKPSSIQRIEQVVGSAFEKRVAIQDTATYRRVKLPALPVPSVL